MGKQWSRFQSDIFDFVAQPTGNAIVRAVAGSGKSTTIVEALGRVAGSSIFLAFNKSIADELKARGVNARTFHSLTYIPVTRARKARTVTADKLRQIIGEKLSGEEIVLYGSFVNKMVGLARQAGFGCLVTESESEWLAIAEHHGLELDNEAADLGDAVKLASNVLRWSNESPLVDFDDLLYFAVKDGITLPKFDVVFVDEAQDTNAIQRAILRKIMHDRSRIIAVGDASQAIYGFRGADSESLNLIAEEFDCVSLPLSITYRCPTAVVQYANQWVPEIQAAPGAPVGEVTTINDWKPADFQASDLVLCRKTAPLIALAYTFIRARKPVQVLGRDIGAGLHALVKKMNARNLIELETKLDAYRQREVEKAIAKKDEAKAEAIEDKCNSILCLIEGVSEDGSVADLTAAIDDLFRDKRGAVTLATIHKAKGLEADRVWWLDRSQCPARWARQPWQQQQEVNLCYVAATRARKALFLIESRR